mgnify:FL=1
MDQVDQIHQAWAAREEFAAPLAEIIHKFAFQEEQRDYLAESGTVRKGVSAVYLAPSSHAGIGTINDIHLVITHERGMELPFATFFDEGSESNNRTGIPNMSVLGKLGSPTTSRANNQFWFQIKQFLLYTYDDDHTRITLNDQEITVDAKNEREQYLARGETSGLYNKATELFKTHILPTTVAYQAQQVMQGSDRELYVALAPHRLFDPRPDKTDLDREIKRSLTGWGSNLSGESLLQKLNQDTMASLNRLHRTQNETLARAKEQGIDRVLVNARQIGKVYNQEAKEWNKVESYRG